MRQLRFLDAQNVKPPNENPVNQNNPRARYDGFYRKWDAVDISPERVRIPLSHHII